MKTRIAPPLHRSSWRASLAAAAATTACAGLPVLAAAPAAAQPGAAVETLNLRPGGARGPFTEISYDGVTDDLLTAGLGKTGLMGAAPAFAVPTAPTAAELRRNAIYVNYRALVDYTALGGMGVLYGPNIDIHGNDTLGEGKIAGRESIVWADGGAGRQNVTLMVQVPDSFDPGKACIVTATSSGSRGVYGAIGTSGDWGLKHGCAVAYTDKGTGNGLHDLMTGTVTARDGTLLNAATAGRDALFKADVDAQTLAAFNAETPNRVAYKHAHSQRNPEKDWGLNTLEAVRFAFYVLNQRFGEASRQFPGQRLATLNAANTLVIASSVSNGAGAALAAAEQDTEGLIDGVAVSEPNSPSRLVAPIRIKQGDLAAVRHGRPLVDYFTFANVYQPCALLSSQAGLSLNPAFWPPAYTDAAQNRCAGLAKLGLIKGATLAEQADAALAKMHAHGWQAESDFLQQSHFRFATNSIAVTYVNALGRFSVTDKVCGYSFANTDLLGNVAPQVATTQAAIFSTGNGIPPASGVNIVYNPSVGGAKLDFLAVSPSTGLADFALDGALCLRGLVTARNVATGAKLTGDEKAMARRVREGINRVTLSGQLQGKPTIIVAGRNDALLPVNQAARAYYARLQLSADMATSRYIEVTNAQHFDTFIAFGALLGYDTRFIPLHVYFVRAMDAMYAHLSEGVALPPSQVVRTTPRATGLTAISAANVPAVSATPALGDLILMKGSTLAIPD